MLLDKYVICIIYIKLIILKAKIGRTNSVAKKTRESCTESYNKPKPGNSLNLSLPEETGDGNFQDFIFLN